jgi:hypothetical protein
VVALEALELSLGEHVQGLPAWCFRLKIAASAVLPFWLLTGHEESVGYLDLGEQYIFPQQTCTVDSSTTLREQVDFLYVGVDLVQRVF